MITQPSDAPCIMVIGAHAADAERGLDCAVALMPHRPWYDRRELRDTLA